MLRRPMSGPRSQLFGTSTWRLADVVRDDRRPEARCDPPGLVARAARGTRRECMAGRPSRGFSAVRRQLLARGISGAELAKLEDAWLPLLEPFPWGEGAARGLRLRGGVLFGIGAQLLEQATPAKQNAAGALWSLVDGARTAAMRDSRRFLRRRRACRVGRGAQTRVAQLRPLTMLGGARRARPARRADARGRRRVARWRMLRYRCRTVPHS